jgi:hypothetical protein
MSPDRRFSIQLSLNGVEVPSARCPDGIHDLDNHAAFPLVVTVLIPVIWEHSSPLLTAPGNGQTCPNCGKKNGAKETYCYSCGHLLKLPTGLTQPITDLDHHTRFGTAHFGEKSTLYLAIRGVSEPFKINLRGEMIIGRSSPKSALGPDIDLASFNAEKLGVSRLHAALKRTGDTVSLMDLQSSNSTFVNGQRMYPHEVRVLRDGDEVRLGKLVIKVIFRH